MFPGKIILGTFVFGRNVLLLRSFHAAFGLGQDDTIQVPVLLAGS